MAGALNSIVYRPIDTWPGELTRHRKASQFSAEFRATIRLLSDEVDHLTDPKYDTLIVIQLAVDGHAIRRDETGLMAHARPEHPGVIVSFDSDRGPLRFSCDRFDSSSLTRSEGWRQNLRAIALGLQALRTVDRYGLGHGTEQYVGFSALPPGRPMGPAAMTVDEAGALLADATGHHGSELVAQLLRGQGVQLAYRVAARKHHPDVGGDPDVFRRLVEARDLLLG